MRMLDWGEIQQTGLLRPAGLYSTKWKRDILKNNPRRKNTLGFSQWPEADDDDDDAQVSPVGGGAAQGRGTCARHERVKGGKKKRHDRRLIHSPAVLTPVFLPPPP